MSVRVDFYHLTDKDIEQVLPKLLEKAYDSKQKIKVQIGEEKKVEVFNDLLWTYSDSSFLPHGSAKNGQAKKQPIWLSADEKNPNSAKFLFLISGAQILAENINNYARVFVVFDAKNNPEITQARELYKELKNLGIELNYWQQTESGWEKK